MNKNTLTTDFDKKVSSLQRQLVELSKKNDNVVVGTKEKPIVTDSDMLPINHFFMQGVYIREMIMYQGSVVIGAIHKDRHMCFLTEGHLTVANEDGVKDYIAPCYIITTPGIRRVLYAHKKSVWYNIHRNPDDLKKVDKIEKLLTCVTYEEYEKYINNKSK